MFNRSEIEKKILAQYSAIRLENARKVENAILEARQNPDYDKLYKKIKDLEYTIAEAKFQNKDTTELDAELNKTKVRARTLLRKIGLNLSDFTLKYNCADCQDSGFIGHEKCKCFKQKINEEIIKESGFELTKLNTFENFRDDIYKDTNQKTQLIQIKALLEEYVNKFPTTKKPCMVLSGQTGVGKTFMLECVTNGVLKRGYTANFLTAFQMNNQFLKYHTCFDANKQSYLNILLDPDLLIIDDLGTEPLLNNVTCEYLYLVITERFLKSKATIFSTNLDGGDILNRYGERIFSRLFDKTKSNVMKITGLDLRTKGENLNNNGRK